MIGNGLLFPGQGSQFVGMGKTRYEKCIEARKLSEEANDILGFDLRSLMFEGPEEKLRLTEYAQPAIFVASAMAFECYKKLGEPFSVAAGHSLGEYSALYASGTFSFRDGLELVSKRGAAMSSENAKGMMYAVLGMEIDKLKDYINRQNGKVEIANINSAVQIVISGSNDAINNVVRDIESDYHEAVTLRKLEVSAPFHCFMMKEAKKTMEKEIDKIPFNVPVIPVIPNVTAIPTRDVEIIKKSLKSQITSTVDWLGSILKMKEMQVAKFYEIGEGDVLKKMNKVITLRPRCCSV